MQKKYKYFLYLSLVCLVTSIVLYFSNKSALIGPFLTGFVVCLAIGIRGSEKFKGLSFTVWIFSGVTAAMFYPSTFQELAGFQLKTLIVPLLQIIMFGMGTAMSLKDFAAVIKTPKAVFIGLACQFTIMPFVGVGLAILFDFPPEIAAGMVLIGSSPSGLASNVMAYIAKANLALSVTLTTVATLLAPIMTPMLMKLLAGQLIPIDFWEMMWGIIKIVILPIIVGLIVNRFAHGKIKWLDEAMPIVSMVGIAFVITIITATGRDSLLEIGLLLILATLMHNVAGFVFGYWGCRLFGLDEQSSRTISLEVGLQNGGLASGIALQMGKVATVGLAPAVFGPMMNITGSTLANWWRDKPMKQKKEAIT